MEYDKVIDKIAEKLQVPAEHLWRILIKQAPVNSILEIGSYILFLIMAIGGIRLIRKFNPELDEDLMVILTILIYGGMIIISTIFISRLPNILSGFVNPEYWALKEIIGK